MNWEEIETAERPVTFMECAIIARYGGEVPKGELWCWDFKNYDLAWECFHRLNPSKYQHHGLRIALRDQPMTTVWTMELCDARKAGMIHSRVFKCFPTPEKLKVTDPNSFFYQIDWTPEFEQEFLVRCYMGIQKYGEEHPEEKTIHCPFVINNRKYMKEGCPPLLCVVSRQEVH